MLVLSRKQKESVIINENIIVTVLSIQGDTVRLGIEAPSEIPVHRQEVYEKITADQLANLHSEVLEDMLADVDLVGVDAGGNQMNIIANDDAVRELPDKADPT
jgi:carbon storage regulator